jgi:hypothetical protein
MSTATLELALRFLKANSYILKDERVFFFFVGGNMIHMPCDEDGAVSRGHLVVAMKSLKKMTTTADSKTTVAIDDAAD